MEKLAEEVAAALSLIVEMLAAIVVAVALVQFLVSYVRKMFRKKQYVHNAMIRARFGSSLAIVLELLLAADILQTAVAPTWDEIGKLAAIAAIRTALNYFLERELREIEKRVSEVPEVDP